MIDFDIIWFCTKCVSTIAWQCICYLFGRSRLDCVSNVAFALSAENVMCTKILQAMSGSVPFLTEKESKIISLFNDNVPYSSNELLDIHHVIDDLNVKLSCNLQLVGDGMPIKSGTIAVVYYAKLDNKDVVIKVKRIGVDNKYKEGLMKMQALTRLLKWVPYIRQWRIADIFAECEIDMLNQVDFKKEVVNCNKMNHFYRKLDDVCIPYAYKDFTDINDRVIVMDRLHGRQLNNINDQDRALYGDIMAKVTIKSLLYDGLYHTDMHAGNVMFMLNDKNKPCLGIFDFGIMAYLNNTEQENIYRFFKCGWIDKDLRAAAETILNRLVTPLELLKSIPKHEKDHLVDALEISLTEAFIDHNDLNPGLVHKFNASIRSHKLRLSSQFCRVIISLAAIAGLAKELSKKKPYMLCIDEAVGDIFKKSSFLADL
jgi:predicted unusual protein kinase regulating ubiquinone biosynthesis (AarF/ABC1/UbiB family)